MAWLARWPKLVLGSVSRTPPGDVGLRPRSREPEWKRVWKRAHVCLPYYNDRSLVQAVAKGVRRYVFSAAGYLRFMQGYHRRMGDVWMPDRSLTIDELLHCLNFLEGGRVTFANDTADLLQTALTSFSLTAGFCAALRGEEIPWLDLRAMRKNWRDSLVPPARHTSRAYCLEYSRASQ
jgi:hypothetical protein